MSSEAVRWPASRFYWAILDTSKLPGSRKRPRGLEFAMEAFVPLPIEELHVAAVPLGEHKMVACALEKSVLRGLSGSIVSLTPEDTPAFVEEHVRLSALEMLTGEWTPASVRRSRKRRSRWLYATALAAVLVVFLGLERRADRNRMRAAELVQESELVRTEVLGNSASRGALPSHLLLQAELRALRQTREAPPGLDLPDAARGLETLLSSWDNSLFIETDSIHVTQDNMHLQARVPDDDTAESLTSGLKALEGWSLQQPSMQATPPEGYRTTLHWRRITEEAAE